MIAKYYHSWRGVKPKVAAEHGAIGCLIYSEPQDDGYTRGQGVPAGTDANPEWRAARQRHGLRLGHPGDPLTPGVGATATPSASR